VGVDDCFLTSACRYPRSTPASATSE
jgi:hypothetical protein